MIIISDNFFSITDFNDVIYNNKKISIDASSLTKIKDSNAFLNSFIEGKIIYGINTGLGPMAQYKIE